MALRLMSHCSFSHYISSPCQAATNDGDDEGANTQTTSADVKPDVDASVVPK